MLQNADGSVVLSPGEVPPIGFVVVGQNPDGSLIAARQGGLSPSPSPAPTPTPGAGGIVVPAIAAKTVYDIGKGMLAPAAPAAAPTTAATAPVAAAAAPTAGAASTGSSIISMSAAGNSAPAGTVIGVDSAGRDIISTGTGAAGSFGGLAAGQVTPMSGLAGVAGAYSLHKQFSDPLQGSTLSQGLQGAAGGAGVGYFAGGPIGMGIGALAGGAIGLARGAFGGRTSGFTLAQRGIRAGGGKMGLFYDPKAGQPYALGGSRAHMKLADGTYYNIEDGGYKEAGADAGWTVDPNVKGGTQAIKWTDPLSIVLTGGYGSSVKEGMQTYLSGSLANGVLSNANGDIEMIRANVLKQIENVGLDEEKMKTQLKALLDAGKIDQARYGQSLYDLDILFNGDASRYDTSTFGEFIQKNTPPPPPAPEAPPAPGTGSPSTTGPLPLPNGAPGLPPGNRVAVGIIPGPNVQQAAQNAAAMPSVGSIPSNGLPAGYRPGSARAGGIVDNRTGQWYPDVNSIPR